MPRSELRERFHEVIFEHDTAAGKAFDVVLIVAIAASVLVVILDSVASIAARHGTALRAAEWLFTLLFTVEYVLRLWCAHRRLGYALSFFGLVDLLSILPTYLSVLVPGSRFLLTIRVLRVMRVFRVLKLGAYVGEADVLSEAIRASRHKITVFIFTVLMVVTVVGSLMYLVEGTDAGFSSIPQGIYWAIVTLTTVGYGDIAPLTTFGRFLASLVMILGYGIIAVPTGIVTVELERASRGRRGGEPVTAGVPGRACPSCGAVGHAEDARYCRRCGAAL